MRPIYNYGFFVLMFAVCFPNMGIAQEIPEHYHPARPNGIGGAFTAIANDENAVWTNPAGISRIRKPRTRRAVNLVRFPNVMVGANTKSRTFYNSLKGSAEASDIGNVVSETESLGDNPLWAMGSAFPMMMVDIGSFPSVIGGYLATTIKSVVDDSSKPDPLARTEAISDVGAVFSMAWTNRTNRINFGIQARSIKRYAFEDYVPVSLLADNEGMKKKLQNESNTSSALALDAGFLWTFSDFWFPTLGIAVLNLPSGCKSDYLNPFSKKRENVCGTKFSGNFSNPDAISVLDPTDIRFGLSITPRFSRKFAARIAFDIHHFFYQLGDQYLGFNGVDTLKLVHGGIEFFIGNPLLPAPFSVSVGINQGYYSMGGTFRWKFITFEIASFGRDVSSTATPKEDRRTVGSLSFDF